MTTRNDDFLKWKKRQGSIIEGSQKRLQKKEISKVKAFEERLSENMANGVARTFNLFCLMSSIDAISIMTLYCGSTASM